MGTCFIVVGMSPDKEFTEWIFFSFFFSFFSLKDKCSAAIHSKSEAWGVVWYRFKEGKICNFLIILFSQNFIEKS